MRSCEIPKGSALHNVCGNRASSYKRLKSSQNRFGKYRIILFPLLEKGGFSLIRDGGV